MGDLTKKQAKREYDKVRRLRIGDLLKIKSRAYYLANKEEINKKTKAYYNANKEIFAENSRKRYIENKEEINAKNTEHRKANIELARAAVKRHRINNPALYSARAARRRVGINDATPSWANHKYINLFYKMAEALGGRMGAKIHVDHIVPINHAKVCGLHCEDNLQLLFAKDNIFKSNQFCIN